ncbi:MAG TPA: SusD/RagB family nutrient-binding outer membrane lipoprotein [Bacteroidia bacterium]|nr:SusD/RagB family nutrient-binding outer membrane lipoprotein [Bacteroidia bacterium]
MKISAFTRYGLVVVLALATETGCKKDYLNINDNPNFPTTVDVSVVLPSAEVAIANAMGNDLQITGSIWAQFWTQSPAASQYKTLEQYSPSSSFFDNVWRNLYADALQNLSFIVTKAGSQGSMQYVACAKILEAYSFQMLTDNFGDIPFSQALQATTIVTPKYDRQQAVYAGIIKLLNDALGLINLTDKVHPGGDDLLFGGDMSKWQKFANTLKLRAYLRISGVDPTSSEAGVRSLSGQNFLGAGETAQVNYISSGGNTNPLYSSTVALGGTPNLLASKTAMDYLLQNNDSRVGAYYSQALVGGYAGLQQGNYNTTTNASGISYPSPNVGANASDPASATAPVKLMSDNESYFLQAEAAARGWLNAGQQQFFYESGIRASYADYGIADSSATKYIAQPAIAYPLAGTFHDQLQAIITQKWISMCGNQGDEAWIEWRRTTFPSFFTQSMVSNIGSGRFPRILLYPSTEVTRNPNMPGQHFIYDKVWWDIN